MSPLDPISSLSPVSGALSDLNPGIHLSSLPSGGAGIPHFSVENQLDPSNSPLSPGEIALHGVASIPSLGELTTPDSWTSMVGQMVSQVNAKQITAGAKVADVLQGGPTPVHEAMIASQEASLSFTFLAELRNKVIDSYQEIMRMQI